MSRSRLPQLTPPKLDIVAASTVEEWDSELERLVTEARLDRSGVVEVPLPASLSATAVARLRDDPEAFARELARPMPRQPSPAARFGTRFHAWVEARFGQQALLDPDDLPGRGDLGIDDEDDLRALIARFESGPFGDRVPHAVEPPFALVLAGQVVRGRIDAVYVEPDGGWLVIDWKTNQRTSTRRPPAAGPLPGRLGRAHGRSARAGRGGFPLRQDRRDRPADDASGPRRVGGIA